MPIERDTQVLQVPGITIRASPALFTFRWGRMLDGLQIERVRLRRPGIPAGR